MNQAAFPPGPGFFSGTAAAPARTPLGKKKGPGKIAGLLLGVFGLVFGVGAASFFWSDIIDTFQNAVTDKIEMTSGTEWADPPGGENFSKNHTDSTVAEETSQPEAALIKPSPVLPAHPNTP